MILLYDISEEEKMSIILDLYSPFKNEVINPTEEYKEKSNVIRNIIIDLAISDEMVLSKPNLSNKEKEEVLKKNVIISKIIPQKLKNEDNTETNIRRV